MSFQEDISPNLSDRQLAALIARFGLRAARPDAARQELPSPIPGLPWTLPQLRLEQARRQPASPRQPDLAEEYGAARQGLAPSIPPALPRQTIAEMPTPPAAALSMPAPFSPGGSLTSAPDVAMEGLGRATTSRPRSPVATPGNAVPGGLPMPAPATPDAAAPDAQTGQVMQAAQQAAAQGDTNLADRLMAFGFAMAASRSPSLFGMLGEGGQAMLQAQRQERQDALRRREVEGGLSVQQARLNLMEAELNWQREPQNPQNIQRLAAARADLARAATAGSESTRPNWQAIERPDGSIYYFDPNSGRTQTPPGEGNRRPGAAVQATRQQGALLAQYNTALRDVERLYQPEMPGLPLSPERQRERAARIAEINRAFEMQGLQLPRQESADDGRRAPATHRWENGRLVPRE
jgi:hypothetical protein